MLDDTPMVKGVLHSGRTCISDPDMIHTLELKGYGEQEKDGLYLDDFESLYLLHSGILILKKGKKQLSFDEFMGMCQTDNHDVMEKFLIYRDLKSRGYVVKDGFGFGSDFRVYERGQFGEKGAKFLIFGLSEGRQEKMGAMQKKIEQITQMGKEPIIAVVERRGEVIYYKINRAHFNENKAASEESFPL
ncbi:MAG: tRNA-intron lyase [Thaumarchaeota archaeon]|nr:tRNA-intron lyase [Nitrososphaerota archaeon]